MAASALGTLGATAVMVAVSSAGVYSDVAIVTLVVLLTSMVAQLGADRVAVAEVHGAGAGAHSGRQRGAELLGLVSLNGVVAAALLISPIGLPLLETPLTSPLSLVEKLAVAAWVCSDTIRLVAAELHRANYRFGWALVSGMGVRAPLFLGAISVLGVVKHDVDRTSLLVAAAIASAVVLLVSMSRASLDFPWWVARPLRALKRLWRGHLSMVLTTCAAALIGGADVWIIGATAEGAVAAPYALAVTVVSGLTIATTAITGGVLPYLAQAVSKGELSEITPRLVPFVRIACLLVVVGYVVIVSLSRPAAILLGGEAYTDITIFVAVLGAGQIVNVAAGIAGAVLIATRRYTALMRATTSVSLLVVVGEAVSGFVFDSPLMVCAVSATGTGLLSVVCAATVRRVSGIRTDAFARVTRLPSVDDEQPLYT
ncbi:hypothetical protein ASG76_00640 [Nocardioides sp. Soil774]|nr:hypothetical protein ASG76_00640 [Nocardioides sp. Soil774]